MLITSVLEFSRLNCVAICAVLVPANLLATVSTLGACFQKRSYAVIRSIGVLASVFALALFGHIGTWFMIGVITPVTFILASLGGTCLAINGWAILGSRSLGRSLQLIWHVIVTTLRPSNGPGDSRRRYS